MAILAEMLAPLVEFHKTSEEASDGDLRLYWDVRIVRGKDTPFMSTSGSSSLPGILATNAALNTAGIVIHQEIEDKVAKPLHGKIQQMIGDLNLAPHMERLTLTVEQDNHNAAPTDPMQTAHQENDE